MTSKDLSFPINQDRIGESEPIDTRGDLLDLLPGVGPGFLGHGRGVARPILLYPAHRRQSVSPLGVEPVANMRVGASDARHYRAAGIPTVVCGLTPNNMGDADEFVELSELEALSEIFTGTAFDYLR